MGVVKYKTRLSFYVSLNPYNRAMSGLPRNLYRAAQVRELDRIAIEQYSIPGITLMERAGHAVFSILQLKWPRINSVAVVCGSGNNAGDGYIIANHAAHAGLRTVVFQVGSAERLSGDARVAYERLQRSQVEIVTFGGQRLDGFDLICDALLGTGAQGTVSDRYHHAIEAINQAGQQNTPIIAVDIPSGLHADTGAILGIAVYAQITVTFIAAKQGMLTASGPDCCGEMVFYDLDVPPAVYEAVARSSEWFRWADMASYVPQRPRAAHKGMYGHALIVGGNHGMPGAVQMAASACARVGSGLVSVATRRFHAAVLSINRPEIMCHAVEAGSGLGILLDKAGVVAIGPGLGHDAWAMDLFAAVIARRKPKVIDADALRLLAQEPSINDNWVLTPHPGEAAALLHCTTREIQANRFKAVEAIQKKYGGICVLKGCGTLVGDEKGEISLCDEGNPGMASGGMGDILTGMIAGFIAQGYALALSSKLGVSLHAAAGDLAAEHGRHGLLASDLLAPMRKLLNR